ncbi:hypothetical protein [Paenibacillus sp. GCM10012303]|uniref:hypothetical protein n=1 Tax=Paenibacillus sp. GCM10012303 TaxID=3317340 RepID=UPI00361BAD54
MSAAGERGSPNGMQFAALRLAPACGQSAGRHLRYRVSERPSRMADKEGLPGAWPSGAGQSYS